MELVLLVQVVVELEDSLLHYHQVELTLVDILVVDMVKMLKAIVLMHQSLLPEVQILELVKVQEIPVMMDQQAYQVQA
jgi:hypothetical protein